MNHLCASEDLQLMHSAEQTLVLYPIKRDAIPCLELTDASTGLVVPDGHHGGRMPLLVRDPHHQIKQRVRTRVHKTRIHPVIS